MKILHTSDWHLGQTLFGESREEEHNRFLDWLISTLEREKVDILIVAGDIFDTATPPNYAIELYYNFIDRVQDIKTLKRVVIISGNHDSANRLKTSQRLLKRLKVIVTADIEDSFIFDMDDAIICAIPFIKNSYLIKTTKVDILDRDKEYKKRLERLYQSCYIKANSLKGDRDIPIIATGHLTTFGSKSSGSERDIYIGGEVEVQGGAFEMFDYVALGHLHKAQRVGERVRYSGSPIPMSFSEKLPKSVTVVEFQGREFSFTKIDIPIYRELIQIRGSLKEVEERLKEIEDSSQSGKLEPFVELIVKDNLLSSADINQRVADVLDNKRIKVLATRVEKELKEVEDLESQKLSLKELDEVEMFKKLLKSNNIEEDEQTPLLIKYKEILQKVQNSEDS